MRRNKGIFVHWNFYSFFLTKQELSTSNTDETHRKVSLDKNKLNWSKALVITKFPTESSEEIKTELGGLLKERLILSVGLTSGKINTKCRANKLTVQQAI